MLTSPDFTGPSVKEIVGFYGALLQTVLYTGTVDRFFGLRLGHRFVSH